MRVVFLLLLALFAGLGQTASAATVTGVVSAASSGQPVAGASITLERWNGLYYATLGTATSNAQGEYAIADAYVGTARVSANATGFLPLESPVVMPAGSGQVSANLALLLPAVISGRVTDHASGAPLAGKTLQALAAGGPYRYADSGSDGSYAFTGLPPGSYSVCLMDYRDAYLNQCWDHVVANLLTSPSNALPVIVAAGEVRQGINFDLDVGAHISGVILNRRTGLPVANSQSLQILLRTAATTYIQLPVQVDANGRYRLDGLAPGSYQAIAQNNFPFYTSQLYAGIDCVGTSCEYPIGTFIVIDAGLGSRDDIDFSLSPGGRLQGQIVDRATLAPIADAEVELWRRDGLLNLPSRIGTTLTDAQGHYGLDHVNHSPHLLVVRSPMYIPQRYPNVPCFIDCMAGSVDGITIAANAVVDLAPMFLDRGVRVFGQARLPGLSSSPFNVELFDSQGQWLGRIYADVRGGYQFPARPPGTYFVSSVTNTQCQLYHWLPCSVGITNSTPVTLATPGESFSADFDLFLEEILSAGFESD